MARKREREKEVKILSETQLTFIRSVEKEYKEGFNLLNSIRQKTLTVYGGSRIAEDDKNYKDIAKICAKMRRKKWGVVTGGGPGIMTAALSNDTNDKVDTIALNIDLETEKIKAISDASMTFSHFSVRKYLLRQSDAFLIAPGGFGTMDEMMELLTLIQTQKYSRVPVVLYNSEFWKGLIEWFKNTLVKKGTVSESSMKIFNLVDSPEQAIKILCARPGEDDILNNSKLYHH